jgi:prepilin-type N-terminal cleavage/methylation domain-containing protein
LGIGLSRKGYTLVELIVVVFLAGMMLFLAVPSMRHVFLSDQLQSTTRQLVATVRELRVDAVREQVDFVVHFDITRHSYWTYSTDMTPEKKDERKKKTLFMPEGVKITDIYHVGGTKKTDGEMETIFYKSGVVQPTVIHLNKEERAATIILEPFLNQVRILDQYIEFPGDGDNS